MKKRLIYLLLFVFFLGSCNNVDDSNKVPNDENIEDIKPTRIIACSDFQGESGHFKSEENVSNIMYSIEQDGFDYADAFFCCGDYDYEYVDSKNGIEILKNFMSYYVDEENMIFVQGNHDEIPVGEDGLSISGKNDPVNKKYGVYVINEDDYMWYNNNEETIKNTAYNLQLYLNDKIKEKFTKPIFILSHLALNYSMRTYYDGDGQYAKYIFDVLNEAGKNGLNIIYLFGHNHSNGWDDYLGGSSIYLKKGDSINIANYSKYEFEELNLYFTYMNAGYIGYYRDVNEGADTTLTMTTFDIYENEVIVNRYDENGKHNLKSCGVKNAYKNETLYEPNTIVYNSSQSININKTIIDKEVEVIS